MPPRARRRRLAPPLGVCPACPSTRRCESSRDQITETEAKRKAATARQRLKEARSELPTATEGNASPGSDDLMRRVLERSNMTIALKRVEANRGSAGVDGMTTSALKPWLKENWPRIRAALEAETYEPALVGWHGIPK